MDAAGAMEEDVHYLRRLGAGYRILGAEGAVLVAVYDAAAGGGNDVSLGPVPSRVAEAKAVIPPLRRSL